MMEIQCSWVHSKRLEMHPIAPYLNEGGTLDNLIDVIVSVVRTYGGLFDQKIKEGLITFGVMESTFQGEKSSVTMQLINMHAPFMVSVHQMAH